MVGLRIFMRAQIDNTTPTTPKGAPNRLLNQPTNQSHFECANRSSHGASNNSRNSRRISHFPKINRHKITHSMISVALWPSLALTTLVDGHTVPSKNAATPSASTKVEKLMDTLSACFATKRRSPKVIL